MEEQDNERVDQAYSLLAETQMPVDQTAADAVSSVMQRHAPKGSFIDEIDNRLK